MSVLTILAVSLLAYNPIDRSAENENGFISVVDNVDLKQYLAQHFISLTEEVNKINLYRTEEFGYFYEVRGLKNGSQVSFKLKIDKADAQSEQYTQIDFDWVKQNINADLEQIIFCYDPQTIDPPNCSPVHDGIICGIYNPITGTC